MTQQTHAGIKGWAEEDRPRERMMSQGAEALSKAELLAILIGSGVPGVSAVALMRQVLADYGDSLKLLGRASVQDLCRYKGMGPAKAITVLAACQLAQRRLEEKAAEKRYIRSSEDVYDYFLPKMQDLSHEEFRVLLLRQDHSVIDCALIGRGGIADAPVDIRLVMEAALRHTAPAIAVCHNHPSGNVTPSRQDDALTERIYKACQLMNIAMLDHVVLTDGNYYSYNDHGKLGV